MMKLLLQVLVPLAMLVLQSHSLAPAPVATPLNMDVPENATVSNSVEQRRLQETRNSEGPWPYCLEETFESCEAYLKSQADDIHIIRVYPSSFDYSRIIISVNGQGIVDRTPVRG
mmetsp:Transcript_14236/g.24163  ORF Transcript_14236/g.24163 Transcript_14236/m.24163 type:complete len:115 (+) Transcript_14236:13-357(+)